MKNKFALALAMVACAALAKSPAQAPESPYLYDEHDLPRDRVALRVIDTETGIACYRFVTQEQFVCSPIPESRLEGRRILFKPSPTESKENE